MPRRNTNPAPRVYGPPTYDLKEVFPMKVMDVLDVRDHVHKPLEFRLRVLAEHTNISGTLCVSLNNGAEQRFILPRRGDRLWVATKLIIERERLRAVEITPAVPVKAKHKSVKRKPKKRSKK